MSAIDTIRTEATEIEQEAEFAATAHRIHGRKWQKRNLYLGLPATFLAAVAGVTAFGELASEVAGPTAMAVAALTAISTFLAPADRASSHRTSSASFSDIRRRANLLRDVHAALADESDKEKIEELVKAVEDLTSRLTETEQGAQTLSESSRAQARSELGPRAQLD